MAIDRTECKMRTSLGNCDPIGGFCTAVKDEICEGLMKAYSLGRGAGARDFLANMLKPSEEEYEPREEAAEVWGAHVCHRTEDSI